MTRSEYMAAISANHGNKAATTAIHRAYYAQFVTRAMRERVIWAFGINQLAAEYRRDEHLSGFDLGAWDALAAVTLASDKLLRDCGDFPTDAGRVCMLKEAAIQAIEANDLSAVIERNGAKP